MDLVVFTEEILNGKLYFLCSVMDDSEKRKCLTAYDSSWEKDFQLVLLVKTNMRFIVTQKFIFCGHMGREGMFLATTILRSKNVKSINKSVSVLSNFIFISFMCFVFSFLMNSLKQKRCQENSHPENSHPSNSPLENFYPENSHSAQKIPTWNIPTHVFKHSHPSV